MEFPQKNFFSADQLGSPKLDDTYVRAAQPEGFINGAMLYPHQLTVVQALLDVEDKRSKCGKVEDKFKSVTNHPIILETTSMVLSEPFGSGKTIELLAFILLRPIPRAQSMKIRDVAHTYRGITSAFSADVTRRFTRENALLRPNLIIVGSSVLTQWENAITNFTNLKCYVIGDYYKFVAFRKMLDAGTIGYYDIVLLKNGKLTGNMVLPGDDPDKSPDCRWMVAAMYAVTSTYCWSRVIYDDFDTIALPGTSPVINALFSVYVSATRFKGGNQYAREEVGTRYTSIKMQLSKSNMKLAAANKDLALFNAFNIRNLPEYTNASVNIPVINAFQYVYANPNDNYIRLIGAMGTADANDIMEMLNGDAINTAADAIGIKTNSAADIFEKLLDTKYKKYMHDIKVLEIITEVENTGDGDDEAKEPSRDQITAYRVAIEKGNVPTISRKSYDLEDMVAELRAKYELSRDENRVSIDRVISNIKEGECQICRLPLEDFDVFIVKCCGLIVCDECGIKGNQVKLRYDHKMKQSCIYGACGNCKAKVTLEHDLIFVDKSFDMMSLIDAKGDEVADEPLVAAVKVAPKVDKTPKLTALMSIIKGRPVDGKPCRLEVMHLLEGRVDIPPAGPKKVLIFASYAETLNSVEQFLTDSEVPYLRLGGTFREKADTIEKFKNTGIALLVNSKQDCAGLNIQFATDLVFMHRINDKNIEAQVVGRLQRIGRTQNAQIHYVVYKNESTV